MRLGRDRLGSGALHFWLILEIVSSAYPSLRNGLLPAVFILRTH